MSETTASVSTSSFARVVANPAHQILDIRPVAAYNGWTLRGERRGGHVPGAVSLPLSWTRFMDWIDAVKDKQLDPEAPVTVYGYVPEDAREMAGKLVRLGFGDVRVYEGFSDEWAADPDRSLERLERYEQLVPPSWLRDLTGWRASEAFMNAYLMGWPRISVYDGGWYEWSSHPELPVEMGVPA